MMISSLAQQISEFIAIKPIEPIDRALTIFATASSIFIGNRYLEGFRRKQEQKKIAKLLVSSIQGHLGQLQEVMAYLNGSLNYSEMKALNTKINQIQNDFIYESALRQIGVFELKEIDIVTDYARNLSSILEDILRSYSIEEKFTNSVFQSHLKRKAEAFMLDAKLYLVALTKRIIQDKDKFREYKELVENDYARIRFYGEIYEFSSEFYEPLTRNDSLKRTEVLFDEIGLRAELENVYNSKKIEFQKLM